MLDKIDEVSDRRLARHLVGLYLEDRPETGGIDILVRHFLALSTPVFNTDHLEINATTANRNPLGLHLLCS